MTLINECKNSSKKIFKQKLLLFLIITIIIFSGTFNYLNLYNSNTALAASSWTQISKSDFIDGTFNNTTIIGIGESAEIKLDFSDINEWINKTPANYPNARVGHALASIFGDDKVMLFGGYSMKNSGMTHNDTWIYDLSKNTWTNKTQTNGPSVRFNHAMSSIFGEDKIILFGGAKVTFGKYYYYNDTWEYNSSGNTWTQKNFTGTGPGARHFHAMASIWDDNKIVLFGGIIGTNNLFNNTWIYDSSNGSWVNKTPAIKPSNYPSGRYGHAIASIWGDDKVVLFGGISDGPSWATGTWVYDLSENNWTEKITITKPPLRAQNAMASIYGDDKVLLFGGWNNSLHYYNDTWLYDLSKNSWAKINPIYSPNKPESRNGPELASIFGTDSVLLFGGVKNNTPNEYLNDTWIYKQNLLPRNGTFVSTPYDTSAECSFKKLFWNANTTQNTSIRFQLRTAISESKLFNNTFLGPDGSPTTYYYSSPANLWQGHYSHRWVQYKVYLNSNVFPDTPSLRNVTIIYNCLPNTFNICPENGSLLHTSKPIFYWTFEDSDSKEQDEFQLLIDDDIDFQSVNYNSGQQSSSNTYWQYPNGTGHSELPDGKWYWKVRTKDSDGDWGKYSKPFKFIIDTVIPYSKIIIPKNDTYYRNLDMIFGSASDSVGSTDLDRVEILIKDLTENLFWDGSNWHSTESWLIPDGKEIWSFDSSDVDWHSGTSYCIHSRAIDLAGNIENPYQRKIFTLDNEDVIFSDPFPLFDNESPTGDIQVGITISDSTSGVNVSAIRYSTSTNAGNYWSSWKIVDGYSNGKTVNVKLNLTFPNGTDNRIRWRAYDMAGNGPTISNEFIVRVNIQEEPVLPEVQLLTPENNSKISKPSVEFSWMILNSDFKNVKFDVYIETENPPKEIVQDNLTVSNLLINELDNKRKYYWTVIPKTKDRVGSCISGVWSFSVEIPIPRVKLITPENGSVIKSISPTLIWELDYNGSDKVTYELYFGPTPDPGLKMDKIPAAHFSIFDLDDNTTYYWYIVPFADELKGLRTEVWSFIVNLSEDTSQPNFDIDLEVYPSNLEIAPGDKSSVKATVTNLGNSNDNVSLKLLIPTGKGIDIIFNGSKNNLIAPGDSHIFDLTVIADINAKEDTVQVTVIAESNFAKKYNLTVRKLAILTVRIKEPETGNGDSDGPTSEFLSWNILIILILIIVLIIILIIILNRKKLMEKKENGQKIKPNEEILTPAPQDLIDSSVKDEKNHNRKLQVTSESMTQLDEMDSTTQKDTIEKDSKPE